VNNGLRLECDDAVDFLQDLDDDSVDLIVTDVPYESLEKHRKVGTTTRLKHSESSSNDWFDVFKNERFPELFYEFYRVLKKDRHLYFMCDQETLFVTKPVGEAAGFKFWKFIVWDKIKIGMGYHYRAQHELVLFFEKGKRKLNNLGVSDVLTIPRIRTDVPAEKPVKLYKTLIEQSTKPGEVVCDPFMGSGAGAEAALGAGRKFWGNDINPDLVEHTRNRIRTHTQPHTKQESIMTSTGEFVPCDNPECTKQQFVKMPGTMPRNWFGVWIESIRKVVRTCSPACLQATKDFYQKRSQQPGGIT
jgi:site-specific DNA-methyltransferase (adenine-specific)